jgi:hypothetical protein
MTKHILLSLEEVQQLPNEGFLKQESTLETTPEEEPDVTPLKDDVPLDDEADEDKDEVDEDEVKLVDDPPEVIEDGLEVVYLTQEVTCQNPCCQHVITGASFHHYEISDETSVTICQQCYRDGYRFCLLTQEVHHISQLTPIWFLNRLFTC